MNDLTTLSRRLEALERENAALRKRNTGKDTRKRSNDANRMLRTKPEGSSGGAFLIVAIIIGLSAALILWGVNHG